jgi:hypothetical protein
MNMRVKVNAKIFKVTSIFILCTFILYGCDKVDLFDKPVPDFPSGTVLFKDDFSKSPNGWGTIGRDGGEIAFEFEGMDITVTTPDTLFWTVNGDKFTDSRIEVDAVLLDGPANDTFGVVCRYQDSGNFYAFMVSHDGYFGILKMQAGQITLANPSGDLEYSEKIRQGGVVNHLMAICQGSTLTFIVNDTLLGQIEDPSFTNGQIGLIAGAYNIPGVKVLFDNLMVIQP